MDLNEALFRAVRECEKARKYAVTMQCVADEAADEYQRSQVALDALQRIKQASAAEDPGTQS